MTRFKTFADGGSLTPVDLNGIRDDAESSFLWRKVQSRTGFLNQFNPEDVGSMAGKLWTFSLITLEATAIGEELGGSYGGLLNGFGRFYLDRAQYQGRLHRARIRAMVATNTIAVTGDVTFNFGLYPVTYLGGADLEVSITAVPMGGSTATVESAASTIANGISGEFPMPVEGSYMFAMTSNGTVPTGHRSIHAVQLEVAPV